MLSLSRCPHARSRTERQTMRAAFRTISCRKVQIGSIKRRKVAVPGRATEQMSGNSLLLCRLNTLMLFICILLWKDKLSLAPSYRSSHNVAGCCDEKKSLLHTFGETGQFSLKGNIS